MSLKFILILALCAMQVNAVNSGTLFSFRNLKSIIEFTRKIYEIIRTGIGSAKTIKLLIETVANISNDENYQQINNKLTDISSQLSYLLKQMEQRLGVIEKKIDGIPLELTIGNVKFRISEQIKNIKKCYENTVKYSSDKQNYNREELENFEKLLTGVTSVKSVRPSLESLFDYVTQSSIGDLNQNFLDLYEKYVKMKGMELCGDGLSQNNYLYNLYTVLISTEMMGFISLSFGYQLQHELLNCSVQHELRQAQIDRENRLTQYFISFKKAIESASLSFRSCDPPENIRDQTFFEMESLYQDILIEERGKNKWDSCRGECITITLESYDICSRVYDCWTIKSPTYCELSDGPRRYQWIEDKDGYVYGNKNGCTGVQRNYKHFLYYGASCHMCWCTCEGTSFTAMQMKSHNTHVFSLFPSQSNITNNMVITGVRLVVEHGIVHIRVKEGQLGDEGQILKDSESWKNNVNMRWGIMETRGGNKNTYVSGRDFAVIDEYHNAINLDDIIVPPGHVVTGIKFGLAQKGEAVNPWQRLEIQVQYMPFNSTSGMLDDSSEPQWMSSDVLHTDDLKVARRRSSEKSTTQNVPTKASNHFIKFGPSIWKEDAGQTTLPFLDSVPVETMSGALSGIGLFHKGSEGYGGFLSFRLYSLNFAQYMIDTQPGHYKYSIDDSDQAEDKQIIGAVLGKIDAFKNHASKIHGGVLLNFISVHVIANIHII